MDFTGIGSIADFAKTLVDRFFPPKMDEGQRAEVTLKLQQVLTERENAVAAAKEAVMVAEMRQRDAFTKRARPSVVYFGLAAIGLVHVVFPMVAWLAVTFSERVIEMPEISLPTEFWTVWGGVCSIWIIGRSVEKRGATNATVSKIARMITGGR